MNANAESQQVAATAWLVVTAAKGIQDYILRTDKLKEMIGASELVDQIPEGVLGQTLAELGLREHESYEVLSATAGGARLVFFSKEKAGLFLRLWPMIVGQFAPGVEVSQGLAPVNGNLADALRSAEGAVVTNRNRLFPRLPVAGPLVGRNPTTGLATTGRLGGEWVDAESLAKLQMARGGGHQLLNKTVLAASTGLQTVDLNHFPTDLHQLAGGERSYLAVVHADANGLGKVVMQLGGAMQTRTPKEAAELLRAFSNAITRATESAIGEAVKPILAAAQKKPGQPLYPFRPIVCAGDDVTVILRASDAIEFTRRFLENFPVQARLKLAQVQQKYGTRAFPDLSVCAGIACVKTAYPFARAYELAESLCKFAKNKTGRKCSALAFHRVTGGLTRDYEDEVKASITTREMLVLTQNPYTVGPVPAGTTCSSLGALFDLMEVIEDLPRGSFRQLVTDAYVSTEQARKDFDRITQVLKDRGAGNQGEKLLKRLRVLTHAEPGTPAWISKSRHTPLMDALELQALDVSAKEVCA